MELTNISGNKATVTFGADELAFLSNAINEALEAVEEWEFPIRTGETLERARQIQTQLSEIVDRVRAS